MHVHARAVPNLNVALTLTLAALLAPACSSGTDDGAGAQGPPPPTTVAASPSPVLAELMPRGPAAAQRARLSSKLGYIGGVQDVDREVNTEAYDKIDENPFLSPADEPLSTFSIDVDTASYANVRRFLTDGALPPPDAVRIEEMVNYFGYTYPAPDGSAPFSVTTEVAGCPWQPAHRLVRIGLQAQRLDDADVPPRNLVFLLDVSGSMGSPDKLPLLQRALPLLIDNLRPEDRVSIVVYAGASGVVLENAEGVEKPRIREALAKLNAGGSTNGGEGIQLAYKLAREGFQSDGINRVILATDGDFNVGVTDQGQLVRMIEKERESGIFLTVLGFGTGNVKDSTMEKLADKGNGNYAYIDNVSEARKVLVTEAGGTLVTVAKDVKIQVEFNPAHVAAYRLIGYENRMLAARDFNDDKKDAGEIGAGHSVTALYEIVPPGAGTVNPEVDPLKYQTGRHPTQAQSTGELMTVKLRYKQPQGTQSALLSYAVQDQGSAWQSASTDFRWAASVAAFGMVLRASDHKGDASYDMVRGMARDAMGQDQHGYRAEFLKLVADASAMDQR